MSSSQQSQRDAEARVAAEAAARRQAEINRLNREISRVNGEMRILESQLERVREAQRELAVIQDWVADDNRRLNQLDCDDPNFWNGYSQGQCSIGYADCLTLASTCVAELNNVADEFRTTEVRMMTEVRGLEDTVASFISALARL